MMDAILNQFSWEPFKMLVNDTIFSIGATINHDATVNFTTDSLKICDADGWSFSAVGTGLSDASSTYTIEVSNDDVKFYDYHPDAKNVNVDDAVDSTHLLWKYMRVKWFANTNVTGTVVLTRTQKK